VVTFGPKKSDQKRGGREKARKGRGKKKGEEGKERVKVTPFIAIVMKYLNNE